MADMIKLTPAAQERVKELLSDRGTPDAYVRLGVKTAGCSGLTYRLEFSDEMSEGDEVVEVAEGVTVLIDPKAVLYLLGTEMDYQVEDLKSGFVFNNPNKKGECGCGESFTV